MQRLVAAYVAQLFPVETVAADTDFLRVCPLPHVLTLRRMHASEQCSGQRMHHLYMKVSTSPWPRTAGAGGHAGAACKHSAGRVLPADGGARMAAA